MVPHWLSSTVGQTRGQVLNCHRRLLGVLLGGGILEASFLCARMVGLVCKGVWVTLGALTGGSERHPVATCVCDEGRG